MVRRLTAAWPIVLVCGAVVLLSTAFLYGTLRDEEEFRFAVLSAWLRVRGAARGEYPFWFPHLGLGVSQPFIPHFGLHPLAPLLTVLSPVTWVRVFLFAHTAWGALGMWLLCRWLKVSGAAAAVCTVTYLFAAPVQNYVLSDFWPSHYVVWTSIPWVLLLTWRLLHDPQPRSWRVSLVLGLVMGLMIANTNPGHAGVYTALAAGIVLTSFTAIRRRWLALGVAALVAVVIASPNILHLVIERRLFADDLSFSTVPDPVLVSDALRQLLRPLVDAEGTRTIFFGAPFVLLAIVGCVWYVRVRADLVLTVGLAFIMAFTLWVPVPLISSRYQFRDPLTLCAILLAGCAADRLWAARRTRSLAALTLVAQTAVVILALWPFIHRTWSPEGVRAVSFRGGSGDAEFSNGLVAAIHAPGRLLYSPRVDDTVVDRALIDDGLGLNALTYKGIAVVNGSFKAVSTDPLWPDQRMFYGWIRTPRALVESDASLDVLAVRYVLSYRGEQVAAGLREIWSGKTGRGVELTLLENPDAGPGAFLIDPERVGEDLPRQPECANDRVLCRDVGVLAAQRDRDVTTIERRFNELRIAWRRSGQPRTLVVTDMYRPAWVATSGSRSLHVASVYGGLIGVSIPAGVSAVRLRYRPTGIIAASIASHASVVLALLGVALIRPRKRQRDPRKDAAFLCR